MRCWTYLFVLGLIQLSQSQRSVPSPIYGITLDDVSDLQSITDSLNYLERFPTVRIVFDEQVSASDYDDAVSQIRPFAFIMGEILDSFYLSSYSETQFSNRVTEYLNAFEDSVDIWEVANEINGEWTGSISASVSKMEYAYNAVKNRSLTASLTLYYNEDPDGNTCWDNAQNEMFTWATNQIPSYIKNGVDYVLVSWYEDDCPGLTPDWDQAFSQLQTMFPNSKIGFGECGTSHKDKKSSYIERYYGKTRDGDISNIASHYIGGYFWWYGAEDFVPKSNSYFKDLNDILADSPQTTITYPVCHNGEALNGLVMNCTTEPSPSGAGKNTIGFLASLLMFIIFML